MKSFTFTLYIRPRGKGRPRFTKTGRTYTPKSTRQYEATIRRAYVDQGGPYFPDEVPLKVEITARLPVPKSWNKARKTAAEGSLCMAKPDADNIGKSVLDALNGTAYEDDSQVVALVVRKYYDVIGAPGSLEVTITDISE